MTTVYAALRNGLLVASDDGDDTAAGDASAGRSEASADGWRTSDHLTGRALECVAVSPEVPERVLVGTFESGLWRSTDGGGSFERVGDGGIEHEAVMSLAVSPHDPDEVWAGTEPSRVYRSTDGGETWAERPGLAALPSASEWYFPPRPDTHHVRWIEVDPRDPERLYVGVEAGAFVLSEDGGETWRERPEGARRDNHSLATHPDAPGRVYAAAGDGYAESGDGGESWNHPQEGLEHRYCWSVAPDPGDPDTVLLSAARGARSAHSPPAETYVYRRTGTSAGSEWHTGGGEADRGACADGAWERLDDRGLPTGEGVLRAVLATAGPGTFYAANNEGLFRSADAGDSWDRLGVAWPERFRERTVRGLAVVG
ncbi:hypothetical protein BRC90_02530 [Halobacteriales archaeon QS_4_69_34]|nr:MAG: hypothetical protein BRC90_02530 [Halobacteriales archaeon QS_4_69_34]